MRCTSEALKRNRAKAKAGNTKNLPNAITSVPALVQPPVPAANEWRWRFYAERITANWQKAVESIIETGKLLIEAKSKVDHGDWQELIEELPFGEDTAQRLMAIARHPVISNAEHVRHLPASWGTLYQLSRLPEPVLLAGIEDHSVHAGMERQEAEALTGVKRSKTKTPKADLPEAEAVEAEVTEQTPPTRETRSAEVSIEEHQAKMAAQDDSPEERAPPGDDLGIPDFPDRNEPELTEAKRAEIDEGMAAWKSTEALSGFIDACEKCPEMVEADLIKARDFVVEAINDALAALHAAQSKADEAA